MVLPARRACYLALDDDQNTRLQRARKPAGRPFCPAKSRGAERGWCTISRHLEDLLHRCGPAHFALVLNDLPAPASRGAAVARPSRARAALATEFVEPIELCPASAFTAKRRSVSPAEGGDQGPLNDSRFAP